MKITFGNPITRLLWGGAVLTVLEVEILKALVDALPPKLRTPTIAQLEACNLVQREIDGRALNFYRRRLGGVSREGLPDLPVRAGEVLLQRMTIRIPGVTEPIYTTMTAIDRQFFCVGLSHDLRQFKESLIDAKELNQSWRSNIVAEDEQPVSAGRKAKSSAS